MKVSKTLIICLSIFFVIITSSMVFAGNTMVDESDDLKVRRYVDALDKRGKLIESYVGRFIFNRSEEHTSELQSQ